MVDLKWKFKIFIAVKLDEELSKEISKVATGLELLKAKITLEKEKNSYVILLRNFGAILGQLYL